MGPDDAVDVDGIARVFGVPAVPGTRRSGPGKTVQPVWGRRMRVLHGRTATGGGFELCIVVEGVALAVVEAVFTDAGEGIGFCSTPGPCLLNSMSSAWRRAASSSGVELGGFGVLPEASGVVGEAVEAALEEFLGGGETMAGFEVGELALHGVDEEADGGAAVVGFLADDLGRVGRGWMLAARWDSASVSASVRDSNSHLGFRLRLGAGAGSRLGVRWAAARWVSRARSMTVWAWAWSKPSLTRSRAASMRWQGWKSL